LRGRSEEKAASPQPSPKGEGSNKRDTPLYLRGRNEEKEPLPVPLRREREDKKRDSPVYLRGHKTVFEDFCGVVLGLKSE